MKILIDNVAIYTANPSKKFISRGYLYVDKGLITAVGEGEPPPELEFADYIIEGKYSIVIPGFVVGIGNIIDYIFRFKALTKNKYEILSTLTINDVQTLLSIALASLTLNGVTSIITYVSPINHKILTGLALAANECWIRVRMLIPVEDMDTNDVEDIIRNVLKSVKEPEAITKGVISFGFYLRKNINKDVIELAKSLNARLYIDDTLVVNDLVQQNPRDFMVLTQTEIKEITKIERISVTSATLWKKGRGFIAFDPLNLHPRVLITSLNKVLEDPRTIVDILCHYNPVNLDIGNKSIEGGNVADIIILDYSKPPVGPIPISEIDIVDEISIANYMVETSLIAGELTVDQGLTLNIGDKHVRKAQAILDSLKH
ncbi:MAG: hypothetical protein QXV06_02405 [Ignisphaera sp.]